VDVDRSEAVRERLTPPSTSTPWQRSVEARSAESVHVQGRGWSQGLRAASLPSTSTPWVNDQVDVDDHDDKDRCTAGEDL
jgi:hypothetical protein